MSFIKKLQQRTKRRAKRVRSRLGASTLRVSVFRSLNHFYAQLIDDVQHKTLVSCSTQELEAITGTKSERAFAVGKEFAKRAVSQGIQSAAFDRGKFLYHGRVKAFAEGLREGGMHI